MTRKTPQQRSTRIDTLERDALVAALQADFRQHGAAAIRDLREQRPGEYMRALAALTPAALDGIARTAGGRVKDNCDFTDDELNSLIWHSLAKEGIGDAQLADIAGNWAAFFDAFAETDLWKRCRAANRIPDAPCIGGKINEATR
jgi:hypothetical protein